MIYLFSFLGSIISFVLWLALVVAVVCAAFLLVRKVYRIILSDINDHYHNNSK